MRRLKSAVQLGSLVIVIITGAPAAAQEFPTKPIELAVPYAAGGSHDLTARALASVAHQYLGQPLLVVLKPGGGGASGSQYVIRAKPEALGSPQRCAEFRSKSSPVTCLALPLYSSPGLSLSRSKSSEARR